jgi:hypothetical protein
MANLTLHFETTEGANPEEVVKDLQQRLTSLPEVKSADTRAEKYRSIGPTEIVTALTLAAGVFQAATLTATALAKLLDSIKELIKSGQGLRQAFVFIGMRKVPIDQLTPKDCEAIAGRVVQG